MNTVILYKAYTDLPFCEREILRYAGCKEADRELSALLQTCIEEAKKQLCYKVCYGTFPVTVTADACDFGAFRVCSKQLAAHLQHCNTAVLFAATVGVGIDRLIAKYGRISPTKALLFQAIGAERIEALCDAFCADIADESPSGQTRRFSPGYGDLPLTFQTDIFSVLNCEKKIGLTLTDRLLMSPSKSVTAIVGLGGDQKPSSNKCSACHRKDCSFRGAL